MVEISLADLGVETGDDVYVAAHAEMVHVTHNCMDIASGENTEWSADGETWFDAVPCWTHPSWPTIDGAVWVWRTEQTDPAAEFATVPEGGWYFRDAFTLPTGAFSIQQDTVKITADNAYTIAVNNVAFGGQGAMDKIGPDNQEWSSVEEYDILAGTVTPGPNEIQVRAMNYFNSGTYSGNPAGIIYYNEVCYDVVDQCESAWAAGCDFEGSNWATFFCYTVPPMTWHLKETVVIDSKDVDGTTSSMTLTNGETYKFVVSGTIWVNRFGATYPSKQYIDAKYCSSDPDWATQSDYPDGGIYDYSSYGGASLLEIYVNGAPVNWGEYNSAHIYEITQFGNGAPVNFAIWDGGIAGWHDDNSGTMTVEIYELY